MHSNQTNRTKKGVLSTVALQRLEERYRELKEQIADLGWVAQGSLHPQPPHAWRVTRKIRAKTVSLAVSAPQALLYKEAIANHRRMEAILHEMRAVSEKFLQKSVPSVQKRPRQKRPKSPLS
jgi:hypothetical protein